MPKNKPNKGLLKRIRVTKSGKVKIGRAFGRHLRSHKRGKLMRSYRKPAYAAGCELSRLRPMLPAGTKLSRGNAQTASQSETTEQAQD